MPRSSLKLVCTTIVLRPTCNGVDVAVTVPPRTARKKLVFDSMVEVPAPGGRLVESLGFAVPLRLRSLDGDVRLVATISTFVTALDVTVSELRLEAFLPADPQTAAILVNRHAGQADQRASDAAGKLD